MINQLLIQIFRADDLFLLQINHFKQAFFTKSMFAKRNDSRLMQMIIPDIKANGAIISIKGHFKYLNYC
jgi:hypothetical protein